MIQRELPKTVIEERAETWQMQGGRFYDLFDSEAMVQVSGAAETVYYFG